VPDEQKIADRKSAATKTRWIGIRLITEIKTATVTYKHHMTAVAVTIMTTMI